MSLGISSVSATAPLFLFADSKSGLDLSTSSLQKSSFAPGKTYIWFSPFLNRLCSLIDFILC